MSVDAYNPEVKLVSATNDTDPIVQITFKNQMQIFVSYDKDEATFYANIVDPLNRGSQMMHGDTKWARVPIEVARQAFLNATEIINKEMNM